MRLGSFGLIEFKPSSMEKPSQELLHLQQQSLKCPRCNSSNTKFCYYNNYSLSQPRHFCKGCKRYWTRGGTLRNVPIGGGCRKNRRIKRSSNTSSPSSDPVSKPTLTSSAHKRTAETVTNHVNPLFFNQSDITFKFPRLHDETEPLSEFGFSSPNMITNALGGCGYGDIGKHYKSVNDNPTTKMIDVITSNSFLPNFPIFLGTSSSTSTTSLIGSSLQHQTFQLGGLKETRPTNQCQVFSNEMNFTKEMKIEQEARPMSQNPVEQFGLFDSSVYWNSMNVGAWPDISNFGSPVSSAI